LLCACCIHRSDEVEDLLKYGAYDLFKEEREGTADKESRAFCEADIDQILKTNSKTATMTAEEQVAKAEKRKLGNVFSKASFVAEDSSTQLDVKDPEFWTKVVGLPAAAPESPSTKLKNSLGIGLRDNEKFAGNLDRAASRRPKHGYREIGLDGTAEVPSGKDLDNVRPLLLRIHCCCVSTASATFPISVLPSQYCIV
jgi:hypothetical protein